MSTFPPPQATSAPTVEPTTAAGIALEAEDTIAPDDYDSDYESLVGTETVSLASSLNQYLEQNGRRYHTYYGPDKNPMPSDQIEEDRLDLLHEITLCISDGALIHSPLDLPNVHRVLDLGTGTGVWAVDFADRNPQASVLGIDVSPMQSMWVPPNCRFELEDFEREWVFSAPFDFIHARTIAQSVSNWPRLLSEAKKYLNPGGWLELGEYSLGVKCDDNTMPADWPPVVLLDMLHRAMAKLGRKFPDDQELKRMLEDAGFVDIRVRNLRLPAGTWPKQPALKRAGELCNKLSETGYEAYALHPLINVLGMTTEEATGYIERATATHKTADMLKVHTYMPYYSVCGRKPYPHEVPPAGAN